MIRPNHGSGTLIAQRRWLACAVLGFVGYSAVMTRLDTQLKSTGGPGIVTFELAGTAERAQRIMALWGDTGRVLARRSLRLDFGYMMSYGLLLGLLLDRSRRRLGHGRVVLWPAYVAVVGDAVEGLSLLHVLHGVTVEHSAGRARTAAIAKFAALAVGLGYSAVGGLSVLRNRHARNTS
jgi:hypothetical protein